MNKMEPTERIKEIFETTCDSDFKYSGNIDEIDCYSLLCKATAMNKLYRLLGCNVLMVTTQYNNEDAVLIIFVIPVSSDEENNKHVTERTMSIIKLLEESFITLDYMDLKNVKEDKFYYLISIKKINSDDF